MNVVLRGLIARAAGYFEKLLTLARDADTARGELQRARAFLGR